MPKPFKLLLAPLLILILSILTPCLLPNLILRVLLVSRYILPLTPFALYILRETSSLLRIPPRPSPQPSLTHVLRRRTPDSPPLRPTRLPPKSLSSAKTLKYLPSFCFPNNVIIAEEEASCLRLNLQLSEQIFDLMNVRCHIPES